MTITRVALFLIVATVLPAEPSRIAVVRGWAFEAPSSFVEKTHDGPDFTVTYFSAIERKMALGVYEGMHPQRFSEDRTSVREEEDRIGGQQVMWSLWEEDQEGSTVFRAETFLIIDPKARHLEKLHIFASAGSSADLDSLRQVARSARKQPANQPPQRNAGSRPSSLDSPASETPSSLGPRG